VIAGVALCRYFGIAARPVVNVIHMMLEYSLNGSVWHTVDLGGSSAAGAACQGQQEQWNQPGLTHGLRPDAVRSGEGGGVAGELENELSPSYGEINESTGCSGVVLASSLLKQVRQAGTKDSFDLAMRAFGSFSADIRRRILTYGLADNGMYSFRPNNEICVHTIHAVAKESPPVLQYQLDQLYKVFVAETDMQEDWCSAMMGVAYLLHRSVRQQDMERRVEFIRFLVDRGWLRMGTGSDIWAEDKARDELLFLNDMESDVAVQPLMPRWWQQWVRGYLGRHRRDNETLAALLGEGPECSVDWAGHGGRSPWLEKQLKLSGTGQVWSDQPDGVPDAERWLLGLPAFARAAAVRGKHRPLIVVGGLDWETGGPGWGRRLGTSPSWQLCVKATQQQMQKSRRQRGEDPGEDLQVNDRVEILMRSAFARYLFELTHAQGGRYLHAWIKTSRDVIPPGYMEPRSEEEAMVLFDVLGWDHFSSRGWGNLFLKRAGPLICRQHNADDGLILMGRRLSDVAAEFAASLDIQWLDGQGRTMEAAAACGRHGQTGTDAGRGIRIRTAMPDPARSRARCKPAPAPLLTTLLLSPWPGGNWRWRFGSMVFHKTTWRSLSWSRAAQVSLPSGPATGGRWPASRSPQPREHWFAFWAIVGRWTN